MASTKYRVETPNVSVPIVTSLQILDDIIGEYYTKMGDKNKYYTAMGDGKFKLFVDDNGFEDDSLEDELGDHSDSANCLYLEFDEENTFPFDVTPQHDGERQQKLYDFLKYCYINGRHPVILSDPDKIDYSILNSIHNRKKMQLIREKYILQCPTICQQIAEQPDDSMLIGLTLGFEHNVPLLQYLADIYQRDKMQLKLQKKPFNHAAFNVTSWCEQNRFLQQIKTRYKDGSDVIDIIKHAMASYLHRIQPEFQTTSPIFGKIADDIFDIVRYFQGASSFITFLLRQKVNETTLPFQWDFCIAVKKSVNANKYAIIDALDISDDEDDDDKSDDNDDKHTFYDCLGQINHKLTENGLIHYCAVVDRQEESNQEVKTVTRIFTETYKEFQEDMSQKYEKFPRQKRFVAVVDRRKCVTQYSGNIPYIKIKETKRMSPKLDDVVFFEAPNNASDIPYEHVPEIYFNHLLQCLIPNFDYVDEKVDYKRGTGMVDERARAIPDSIENCVKMKKIVSHITGLSACNGALLTFSFHVEQEDEIKCYLWWQGKCIRFLPSDIIDILPQIFDETFERNNKFTKSIVSKEIVTSLKYRDVHFNNWFRKISILENPSDNVKKYIIDDETMQWNPMDYSRLNDKINKEHNL